MEKPLLGTLAGGLSFWIFCLAKLYYTRSFISNEIGRYKELTEYFLDELSLSQ